jgi:hypothetical protein
LEWAQDTNTQTAYPEGDQSWSTIRSLYFIALMETDYPMQSEMFAKIFKGLGHQMHLIQDMAVPAHVRNDAHPFENPVDWFPIVGGYDYVHNTLYFENWAKKNDEAIYLLGSTVISPALSYDLSYSPGLSPISQLWDANVYVQVNPSVTTAQGLSEYTNANFFSDDTIFSKERYADTPDDKHYFPFPNHDSTNVDELINDGIIPSDILSEDGVSDKKLYLKKDSHGETIDHFVRVGLLAYYCDTADLIDHILPATCYLDEKCHEDYAAKLVPRAVGYSAALLNYFFRGAIEVTPPNDFVYSVIDGSATDQKFEYIKTNLRNATLDEEEMVDGTLVAVARYKRIINYSPDLSVEIEPGQPKQPNEPLDSSSRESEYSYSVSAQDTTLLNTSAPTEVTFDFTADPIPAGVTDLTLQVVFLGTLGNEVDTAVAVGMVDLTEPTHFTFFNSTDEMPNADGSALVPAANKGYPRDFIVAFTGMDPDADDGVVDKTAYFGFYETYDPLIVVEDLAPAAYFRIVALMDARQHAYMVMDSGNSAFCPPIWSFRESDGAVYQEDASGGYVPGIQLKPTSCDTGQPFSHRGIWQHHTYYQYQCGETNCDYLLEQRSNVSETAMVSLSEKINFPNHVISYTPPTCAEPGGDLGKKIETRLCYP